MTIAELQQRYESAKRDMEQAERLMRIIRRLPERDEYQAGDAIKFISPDNFFVYTRSNSGKWDNRRGQLFTWDEAVMRPFEQGANITDVLIATKWVSILKRELP